MAQRAEWRQKGQTAVTTQRIFQRISFRLYFSASVSIAIAAFFSFHASTGSNPDKWRKKKSSLQQN
jgi:hypothetical protein